MPGGIRAVVAVLLPREHLPFIREWCRNNAEQGWETVLYDNTGSKGSLRETCSFHVDRWVANGDDARGNHYARHTAALSDADVQEQLREEVRGLPVTIVPWQPRDSDGEVVFGQVEAYVDFIVRNRDRVDWAAFIDCDEYLYAADGFSWDQLLARVTALDCDRAVLAGTLYESRWTREGTPRSRRGLRRIGPQLEAPKNIVRLTQALRADIHYAWTMAGADRAARIDPTQFGFRHYRETATPEISIDVVTTPLRTSRDESIPVPPE
jgi:hypothetical protein